MATLELFPKEQIIGVFRGFQEGGLEFHADLVLPYRTDFQSRPMHGQFVLVQLETSSEAVLGRITSFSSEGKLAAGSGEEFNIRAVRENRAVPEDLREQYLKYRVNIRVLGVVRLSSAGKIGFVPSHRRLPHVGSPVSFPSGDVLREIAGHNVEEAAELGHFALGEYIYSEGAQHANTSPGFQLASPEVLVRFRVQDLVSRRSFIFARAGFGKSNLNKFLFSRLYQTTPHVEKRNGRKVPVGTVIFDPDGEYFWPDDKGRPGLCDVRELEDKLVVFTSRHSASAFYQSFVAGGIKLDIRRLRPGDVIAIALGPDKQDQQNVRKLRGLDQGRWAELVNLIHEHGNQCPLEDMTRLLDLQIGQQDAEALAARGNMTAIVRMLHDPGSQLMDKLIHALSKGKLCVIDVSQMRGAQSMILAGLVLRRIFDRNQNEFTSADSKTIPTIAVIEEAQAVLREGSTSTEPFVSWVKEGRKYDLGAVLITQQPGSIPMEILSQGDNWFIFHLLSSHDLHNLQKANAHFSNDLLSALHNEPIPGHCVFWSSVGGKSYPVSIRVLSFEQMYPLRDPNNDQRAAATYAQELVDEFQKGMDQESVIGASPGGAPGTPSGPGAQSFDVLLSLENSCATALQREIDLMGKLHGEGAAWGALKAFVKERLPATVDDRDAFAYNLVARVLTRVLGGKQGDAWHSFKHPTRGTTYVKIGPEPDTH